MKVTPRSEQECRELAYSLIEKGQYQAQLVSFQETDEHGNPLMSQNGNAKTNIRLKVWDNAGKDHSIFDILTDHEKMAYKTRHFAEAFGLLDYFEKGELPGHLKIGETCIVDITIQKGKENPKGGMYPDKNAVVDYFVSKNAPAKEIDKSQSHALESADIPF